MDDKNQVQLQKIEAPNIVTEGNEKQQDIQQQQQKNTKKAVVQQITEPLQSKIQYKIMGLEPFLINQEDDEITFIEGRIQYIQGLQICINLRKLCLRTNLIVKIEGLENCTLLKELDLYDNRLTKIENLESLTELEFLDLSFNNIKEINNLGNQKKLQKLFLLSNKIKKIQNLDFPELTMLEIGSNKIQVIENLDKLPKLRELFMGKNRIQHIENLEPLAQTLEILVLSANKIATISPKIGCLINLTQFQIAENFITTMENLEGLQNLDLLDVAYNKITQINGIQTLQLLKDLWVCNTYMKQLNNNLIENFTDFAVLKYNQGLKTIYLEQNPIAQFPDYKMQLLQVIPTLEQIDALNVKK